MQHPQEIAAFIDRLGTGCFDFVVLLTGVGVTALLRESEQLGRLDQTLSALRQTTTVCRGPKPTAVLRRYGVPIGVATNEPYTSTELLEALSGVDLETKRVALLHYGERSDSLADGLAARGARLDELCLYEWQLPEDVEPLRKLVSELVGGTVDAMALTSQIQCRHLFQVAAGIDQSGALAGALNTQVVVAVIGPICAAAVRKLGVIPRVMPSHPKMGSLILALADYFELTDRGQAIQEG